MSSAENQRIRLLQISEKPRQGVREAASYGLFSGEIVALEMRSNMRKELCVDTLRQLAASGRIAEGAILHSDRGNQYTSADFRSALRKHGLLQSLSGTGHCFDNARMESFFATLKKEKIYQIAAYKLPRDDVKTIVFRYIFAYYNRVRIYTRNPFGLPPTQYRLWAEKSAAELVA